MQILYLPEIFFYENFRPMRSVERSKTDCIIDYSLSTTLRGSHFFLPVSTHGKTYAFEHDICGAYTSVTEDVAEEMGLKVIGEQAMRTATQTIRVKIATTDSLVIGNVIYRNPLVRVENEFAQLYPHSGLLGNDFMRRMESMILYPADKKMVFPLKTRHSGRKPNMIKGNGLYFLRTSFENQPMLFAFDSGANATAILAPFYERHRAWFDQNSREDTLTIQEPGKSSFLRCMKLKAFPVKLGKTSVQVPNCLVLPDTHFHVFGDEEGLLGTSFIDCFRKITVNFRDMQVEVKK